MKSLTGIRRDSQPTFSREHQLTGNNWLFPVLCGGDVDATRTASGLSPFRVATGQVHEVDERGPIEAGSIPAPCISSFPHPSELSTSQTRSRQWR